MNSLEDTLSTLDHDSRAMARMAMDGAREIFQAGESELMRTKTYRNKLLGVEIIIGKWVRVRSTRPHPYLLEHDPATRVWIQDTITRHLASTRADEHRHP